MSGNELVESSLPRILIVDDNQDIHRDFRMAFANESANPELEATEALVFPEKQNSGSLAPKYELAHALNGQEAIHVLKEALAAQTPFQLAFVDIRMPGIDGVETVARLWQIDPRLHVVFVTAYADYSWEDLTRKLGPSDKLLLLKKPFEFIEVVQMASALTEKWFLARQAALKLEEMELLVSKRTQKLLELQRSETDWLRQQDQSKQRELAACLRELRREAEGLLLPLEHSSGAVDPQRNEVRQNVRRLVQLIEQMSSIGQGGGPAFGAVLQNGHPGSERNDLLAGTTADPEARFGSDDAKVAAEKDSLVILVVSGTSENSGWLTGEFSAECKVIRSLGGNRGLEQARELVPDLVVVEVGMPGMDGLELCRRLKDDEMASHIPVVLFGSDEAGHFQLQALEAGAEEYVTRQTGASRLRARVQTLLQARCKLQEAFREDRLWHPRELATNQVDLKFLRRTTELVEKHMSDFEFDVEVLAQKTFMSRRQLLRKLKAVAGCTPNVFIRRQRLQRAAELLKTSGMTVSEITYAVGFSDLKHFRTVFREQFGVSPGEYARNEGAP